MTVGQAREKAREWVQHHAAGLKTFAGAYFSGSVVDLSDGDELSKYSDVDLVVVLNVEEPPLKPGKFVYEGVLLEVTYLPWQAISDPDVVLGSYHLAGSFRKDTIIQDPTGHLRKLQVGVASQFRNKIWVRRRAENVVHKIEHGLCNMKMTAPFHDKVTSWLFPTGITTHLVLVAALENPTVRKRYLAAKHVLGMYGHGDIYEELVGYLGCKDFTKEQVEQHLAFLARVFDDAAEVARTPFFFSSDITPDARPIAIDGSAYLIKSGYHREAVFWIVATFARCLKILETDGPEHLFQSHTAVFQDMVAELGLRSDGDFQLRAQQTLDFMPTLWEIAEDIINSKEGES